MIFSCLHLEQEYMECIFEEVGLFSVPKPAQLGCRVGGCRCLLLLAMSVHLALALTGVPSTEFCIACTCISKRAPLLARADETAPASGAATFGTHPVHQQAGSASVSL